MINQKRFGIIRKENALVNINTQIKSTKPKKLLPLTSDVIFKAVFSRPGNEDVLKALLEAILNVKIKKVVVQNPELPIDFSDSKAGVMDIKVTVDDNTVCGIEMHFIELPKFIKKVTIPGSELEQWLWLIVGKGGNMVELEERVKEIAKAEETLKELSMDKEAWYLYEARDMAKRDYNTGMKNAEQRGWNNGILEGEKRGEKIGEQRGEKKSKLEVAKKMLKKKIPVLDIIEFTGLSKEELAEIK